MLRRGFQLVVAASALASMSVGARAQTACVNIAGQSLDPAAIYDSRHQCSTCPGQAAAPNLCRTLNRLMVPYWSASADLVSIPHRGLWGQPLSGGASENTLAALKAALAAGYRTIEIDALLGGPDARGKRVVVMGHYFSMISANGPRDRAPASYSPSEITSFFMNRRDTSPAWEPDNRLPLGRDIIAWAKANQVILTIDPKLPASAPPSEYEQIMAYVLDDAFDQDALGNIVLKTTDDYPTSRNVMQQFLKAPFTAYEGKFLWSPISNKDNTIPLSTVTAVIKQWHTNTNSSKQVATYEIQPYSPSYPGSNPFDADGRTWANLIDYVKGLTPLGKRSAFWSVDPMSDKGTIGRLYDFKFIGNTPDDVRGNPFANLQYRYARHVAMITDRPDVYSALTISPY